MKIKNVYFAAGFSAFYFDDQAAIKAGAKPDGFTYPGTAGTPGFDRIRQRGECISVLLELENGQIAEGDCAAVQYSGAAGRDPLFTCARFLPFLQRHIAPMLLGRDMRSFRDNAGFFDNLQIDGKPLHTAIRYGLSQALLDATARATGRLKAEVICAEYDLPVIAEPLALFGQSGDDRYSAVDKMILKGVDALPHGLINNVASKLGKNGGKLAEYVTWLKNRIEGLRPDSHYQPQLHIDVYGTVGEIFDNDAGRIADYLVALEKRAAPFQLYIEGPADAGSKAGQISLLGEIKSALEARASTVRIVADEWCNTFQDVMDFVDAGCCHMVQVKTPDLGSIHNTVEAVLYCKTHGVEAYQGGTCNETDISARCCVNIAQATRPQRVLVKPGMGFDEGMTVVYNEMNRNLAILAARDTA
jgi:methylaspartate ammonia-lyase